jgi:hypothetical protein
MAMLDSETTTKILSLKRQIDLLYKEAKARPSFARCDICGAGDFKTKNGIVFKVKTAIHGYAHRSSQSPQLCHRHASGWALSHGWYNPLDKRSNEEIDLHFAEFLAKQLMKSNDAAKLREKNAA